MQKLHSILLLIAVPLTLFGEFKLSVCAIFQNESPYLKEWIEFHRLQGVEHFYLYNNLSTDSYETVLEPYIEKELVTLVDWPFSYTLGEHMAWLAIQRNAYNDCLSEYGSQSAWIAFIDVDEFLFCPCTGTIPQFLEDYSSYGGIGVNWLLFGTSNIEQVPEDRLLIETLVRCSKWNHSRNKRYKSIVQPKYTKSALSAHSFTYHKGYIAVDAYKDPIQHHTNITSKTNKIRINHYWTRDERYFREKKIKSRQGRYKYEDELYQRRLAAHYNICKNNSILRYVPTLREKVFGNTD